MAKRSGKKRFANVKTTPLALDAMVTDKAKDLFESNNIYTHSELEARHEIELEKYIKKVQIESRIMGELATSHILPPAIRYQNILIKNIKGLKELGLPESSYSAQQKTPAGEVRKSGIQPMVRGAIRHGGISSNGNNTLMLFCFAIPYTSESLRRRSSLRKRASPRSARDFSLIPSNLRSCLSAGK